MTRKIAINKHNQQKSARTSLVAKGNKWKYLLLLFLVFGLAGSAMAQAGRRGVPSMRYGFAFSPFNEGELADAQKIFLDESRSAIKNVQSRWIDSICYYTMTGECYYQMGQLPEAMEQYTAAVKLIVAFSDWMTQVQFSANIPTATQQNPKLAINWGNRKRATMLGKYKNSYLTGQGRIDNTQQYQSGGVVEKPILFGIDAIEIVRCSTLAIRRRMELLGPASKDDPLNGQLVTAMSRRPCMPNHWSECFVDVQLGLALIAAGKDSQGIATLQRSLAAAGQYEHPLTAVALLELGRVAMKSGDLKAAADHFEEATFSAAFYENIDLLEEAFRYATITHIMIDGAKPYPALGLAEEWAKRNRFRKLDASLLISMADCEISMHQPANFAQAAKCLSEATGVIGRRDMGAGAIGARLAMAQASVAFASGNAAQGNESLAMAMRYMAHGSIWLFHIGLVDQLYLSGGVTPRNAMDRFDEVLRDPMPLDWMRDPMESLAVLLTPHGLAMEHWFEVALARNEMDKALEIADRIRRHRFYSTLDFGGRLESLRWLFAGPESALSEQDQIFKRDLLTRFPGYDGLTKQSIALVETLRAMPIAPDTDEAKATQRVALEKLREVSLAQEAMLREMAVGRNPTSLIFPPILSTPELQKRLPEGHAMLVFLRTARGYHAFLLNREQYAHWTINSDETIGRNLIALLRDLGQFDRNRDLSFRELTDEKWKKSGEKLLDSILTSSKVDLSKSFERLIIVPDGLFWYVPFEALQVAKGEATESLIDLVEVTYAPTAAMAVGTGRGKALNQRTGVVVGQLFPRDDATVAKEQFKQLVDVLPDVSEIPTPLAAVSSDYRMMLDRLVVFSDLDESGKTPYGWYPIPATTRYRAGSTLADWMMLPWGGPRSVILPGYHTAAENGLKGIDRATAGDEIFLSVCGLTAAGADTILLSRWRTGGKIAYDMTREFTQELPHTSPAAAWQRAILLAREATLDPDAEPRVKKDQNDEPPKADHPFFWASGILITGESDGAPVDEVAVDEVAAEPVEQPMVEPAAEPAAEPVEDSAEESASKPDDGPKEE